MIYRTPDLDLLYWLFLMEIFIYSRPQLVAISFLFDAGLSHFSFLVSKRNLIELILFLIFSAMLDVQDQNDLLEYSKQDRDGLYTFLTTVGNEKTFLVIGVCGKYSRHDGSFNPPWKNNLRP